MLTSKIKLYRGHPHSTYTQRGRAQRGQAKCARLRTRGEGFSRLRTYAKQIFLGPRNLKTFFFLYNRSYYIEEGGGRGGREYIESTYACIKGDQPKCLRLRTRKDGDLIFGHFCAYVLYGIDFGDLNLITPQYLTIYI